MDIHLHIERLVLDGLPLEQGQGELLRAALEQELVRLLGDDRWARQFGDGAAWASVQGAPLGLSESASPAQMGTQLAGSLCQGMGGLS